MMSDIAVIISVYHKTDLIKLELSLKSIINQSLKPDVILIVCDGCSTEWISVSIGNIDFHGIKICVTGYEENKGPGYARDYGIRNTTQKYIAIMDSDDICMPERLELQYQFMQKNPTVSVVGGLIKEFNKESAQIRFRNVPLSYDDVMKTVKIKSPINNVTSFFIREDYLIVGGYPALRSSEDYCLWVRFISYGKIICNINKVLVNAEFDESALVRRHGWLHFCNDKFTQDELLGNKIIAYPEYCRNILKYFVFRYMPNSLKSILYKFILRQNKLLK